jgi:putative ABC transport system permease protein
MFVRYVWADLVRNPRRTLSTAVGIMLGVGFSCAILFFVDGLSASMTQRAAAPLAIDMQLVSNELLTGDVRLRMAVEPIAPAEPGDVIRVRLEFANGGETPANEVIVRSVPAAGLVYVAGSAVIDGEVVAAETENPFASGPGKVGVNIGTVEPGASVVMGYQVTVSAARDISEQDFASTFSTREAVMPVVANAPEPKSLAKLVPEIEALDGVSFAAQLSFVDLPPGALVAGAPVDGLVRVFGFDPSYTEHDATIKIVEGSQVAGEAMISAEAAASRSVGVGDAVSLALPDGSQLEARVRSQRHRRSHPSALALLEPEGRQSRELHLRSTHARRRFGDVRGCGRACVQEGDHRQRRAGEEPAGSRDRRRRRRGAPRRRTGRRTGPDSADRLGNFRRGRGRDLLA